MIFDMNKNAKYYPWKPIEITADDLEAGLGHQKMRLAVARARVAIGAASVERMLNANGHLDTGKDIKAER